MTIVKHISRRDPLEEMACAMLRKSADNTNIYCGDGTTTSTVLAASIFKKGQRMLMAGNNPIRLKKGIEIARDHVIDFLEEIKLEVRDREQLRQCALVHFGFMRFRRITTKRWLT